MEMLAGITLYLCTCIYFNQSAFELQCPIYMLLYLDRLNFAEAVVYCALFYIKLFINRVYKCLVPFSLVQFTIIAARTDTLNQRKILIIIIMSHRKFDIIFAFIGKMYMLDGICYIDAFKYSDIII